MPRKKTETTAPVAEAKKKKPSTANKTARARETKEKTVKKKSDEKAETVEAEIVQESGKKRGYGKNGNLISIGDRTTEEQREITKLGGIKSGESRRKKKSLREFGQAFLMQDTSPLFKSLMQTHEVESDDMTNVAALFVRVFNKAMSTGDLNAARQVVEWAGMAPLQEMKENEAIAKMAQVVQLAQQSENNEDSGYDNVVFYIPDNGRTIITDDVVEE